MSQAVVTASRPVSSFFKGRSIRLVTFREAAPGATNLIWFPFGGGNALAFRQCAELLPESWGVYALDPPGHVRTDGEPLRHVTTMKDLYVESLPWGLLNQAVLVGHSLGAYVALALASELEKRQGRARGVVVAAAPAPGRRLRQRRLSLMNADELFQWIHGMGALAGSSVAEGREMFDLFEVALRADIDAYESFDERPVVDAPVLVLAGLQDAVCKLEDVRAWSSELPRSQFQTVDDGHLFVLSSPRELAKHLTHFVGAN